MRSKKRKEKCAAIYYSLSLSLSLSLALSLSLSLSRSLALSLALSLSLFLSLSLSHSLSPLICMGILTEGLVLAQGTLGVETAALGFRG